MEHEDQQMTKIYKDFFVFCYIWIGLKVTEINQIKATMDFRIFSFTQIQYESGHTLLNLAFVLLFHFEKPISSNIC